MNKKTYGLFVVAVAIFLTSGCTGSTTQQSDDTGQTSVTVGGGMDTTVDMSDDDLQVETPDASVDMSGDGIQVETPGVSVDIN